MARVCSGMICCHVKLAYFVLWVGCICNFAFAESLIDLLNSLSAVDCIRANDVQTYYKVSVEKCKISTSSVVGSKTMSRTEKLCLPEVN